jgi:hypothetical protein
VAGIAPVSALRTEILTEIRTARTEIRTARTETSTAGNPHRTACVVRHLT